MPELWVCCTSRGQQGPEASPRPWRAEWIVDRQMSSFSLTIIVSTEICIGALGILDRIAPSWDSASTTRYCIVAYTSLYGRFITNHQWNSACLIWRVFALFLFYVIALANLHLCYLAASGPSHSYPPRSKNNCIPRSCFNQRMPAEGNHLISETPFNYLLPVLWSLLQN